MKETGQSVWCELALDLVMPARTLDEISNVSDWNGRQAATARTASGNQKVPGLLLSMRK